MYARLTRIQNIVGVTMARQRYEAEERANL